MSELAALEGRVTRIENQITAGFERVENLLRSEINDLKTEQIKDLREANARLGDDQRRLWDVVTGLLARENQRTGGERRLNSLWNIVSAVIGGSIGVIGTWLAKGGGTPHP